MNDDPQYCYIDVDTHDVTNFQEFILFLVLFFIIILFLCMNIKNMIEIIKISQSEGSKILFVLNILITITLFWEFSQKLEQLISFIYNRLYESKKEYIILQAQIYYCFTMLKFAFYYILILRVSFLWLRLIINSPNMSYFYNTYCDAIFIILSVVIQIVYLFNILIYFQCTQGLLNDWRNISVVIVTTLITIIFMFSVWIFYKSIRNESCIPDDFKNKVLYLMVFLIISGIGRIVWFFLLHFYEEWVNNIKHYNSDLFVDEGYGWFIYLLIYQNLVNMLPILSLIYIFSPKPNNRSEIQDNYVSDQTEEDTLNP